MKSFSALFAGRDDVAGLYDLPAGVKPSEKGKLAGNAQTLRQVITEADYKSHNAGKRRLGIVPIRPDTNATAWFALDADLYKTPTLHADLAKKIEKARLPLVITKSKSGGAHLWCFFRDPIPAKKAREIALSYVKKLGLSPKTEVFPKQDTIKIADDGSWINLPYFGKTCLGLDADGETELSLADFIEYANTRVVTLDDAKIADKNAEDDTSDAPPCIEAMLKEGLEEGGRNSALTQIAVYLLKSSPDDWEDRLNEYNQTICHPPLSPKEIGTITKSLHGKQYAYLCNQQPMCSLCDKDACLRRKYGVGTGQAGHDEHTPVQIEKIEKIDGDEPSYRVTIQGRTVEIPNAEQLSNFRLFRLHVLKRLDVMIGGVKQKHWDDYVTRLMAGLDTIPAPQDTLLHARIVHEFMEWAKRAAARTGPDVLIGGQVYYNEKTKRAYFVGNDFLEICDRKFKKDRNYIWRVMHDAGAELTTLQIGNTAHRVWSMPVDDRIIEGRESV